MLLLTETVIKTDFSIKIFLFLNFTVLYYKYSR